MFFQVGGCCSKEASGHFGQRDRDEAVPGSQKPAGVGREGGAGPRRRTCVGSHNMVKQTDLVQPDELDHPDPSAVTIPRWVIQGRLHLDEDVFKSSTRMEAHQEAAWLHSCSPHSA